MPFRYFLDVPRPVVPVKKRLTWTGDNLVEWQEWLTPLGFTASVDGDTLQLYYPAGPTTLTLTVGQLMTGAADDSAFDGVIYDSDSQIPDAEWVTP